MTKFGKFQMVLLVFNLKLSYLFYSLKLEISQFKEYYPSFYIGNISDDSGGPWNSKQQCWQYKDLVRLITFPSTIMLSGSEVFKKSQYLLNYGSADNPYFFFYVEAYLEIALCAVECQNLDHSTSFQIGIHSNRYVHTYLIWDKTTFFILLLEANHS